MNSHIGLKSIATKLWKSYIRSYTYQDIPQYQFPSTDTPASDEPVMLLGFCICGVMLEESRRLEKVAGVVGTADAAKVSQMYQLFKKFNNLQIYPSMAGLTRCGISLW
jgi:hypothetical protein